MNPRDLPRFLLNCQRWKLCAMLLLTALALWAVLTAWQVREYRHERLLFEETLQRQADAISGSLVGGVRSHRRMGPFFEENVQGALDELTRSRDILSVAIAYYGALEPPPDLERGNVGQPQLLLFSGQRTLLTSPLSPQSHLYRLVERFELTQASGGGHGFGGYGFGYRQEGAGGAAVDHGTGGYFASLLVIDRSGVDEQLRRAFWLRSWVVAAGGLVLICLAGGWLATIRLVQAQSRTRLLEVESRHFRDLSQAAAGLAHETRNPLGLVRGWTQRLASSPHNTQEQQQQARAVIEECDRITARINQFLAFARPCQPKPEPVPMRELLQELTMLLEPDLEAKSLRLESKVAPQAERLMIDREMFRQVLFNLISNAIHFAPAGSAVDVEVTRDRPERGRIEVRDRGPGVPPDEVEMLFSPYYTTRANGTGLGLAIVRRLTTAHGWDVAYRPRPEGGACFVVEQIHD